MTNGILGAIIANFNNSMNQDKNKNLKEDFFKSKLGLYFAKIDLINALQVTFGIDQA